MTLHEIMSEDTIDCFTCLAVYVSSVIKTNSPTSGGKISSTLLERETQFSKTNDKITSYNILQKDKYGACFDVIK